MSDYIRTILSEKQEQTLVDAITAAELLTSGELRIHLEKSTGRKGAQVRAKTLFGALKMHTTGIGLHHSFIDALKAGKLMI